MRFAPDPGAYTRTEVITVTQDESPAGGSFSVKSWTYPDGGRECVIYRAGTADRSERGQVVRSIPHPLPDPDHALVRVLLPVRQWQGPVVGYLVDPRVCPGWVAAQSALNAIRNARRAAGKARRLARSNGFVYMSTLTVPETGPGRDRAAVVRLWREFSRSRHGVRFFHRVHGGWLAFPEEHPKSPGRFHLHVLHANRVHAVRLRHEWTRFLLARGYRLPDGSRCVQTHAKYWGSARKAAKYASKAVAYAVKSFGVIAGRVPGVHRYLVSQGLTDGAVIASGLSYRAATALILPGSVMRGSDRTDPAWFLWSAWDPPRGRASASP